MQEARRDQSESEKRVRKEKTKRRGQERTFLCWLFRRAHVSLVPCDAVWKERKKEQTFTSA